ncbi:hypothetical protein P43SY_002395 [Pythium insidiosum]|uniref:Myb-like DNA-binding protein n=1 Tax=Pythium insidiosum TaxID=114742 RepID=A0AAD5Q567_PYTIN|nr:hypothetical protein P43SY_002395 [Pythium insidiosum]
MGSSTSPPCAESARNTAIMPVATEPMNKKRKIDHRADDSPQGHLPASPATTSTSTSGVLDRVGEVLSTCSVVVDRVDPTLVSSEHGLSKSVVALDISLLQSLVTTLRAHDVDGVRKRLRELVGDDLKTLRTLRDAVVAEVDAPVSSGRSPSPSPSTSSSAAAPSASGSTSPVSSSHHNSAEEKPMLHEAAAAQALTGLRLSSAGSGSSAAADAAAAVAAVAPLPTVSTQSSSTPAASFASATSISLPSMSPPPHGLSIFAPHSTDLPMFGFPTPTLFTPSSSLSSGATPTASAMSPLGTPGTPLPSIFARGLLAPISSPYNIQTPKVPMDYPPAASPFGMLPAGSPLLTPNTQQHMAPFDWKNLPVPPSMHGSAPPPSASTAAATSTSSSSVLTGASVDAIPMLTPVTSLYRPTQQANGQASPVKCKSITAKQLVATSATSPVNSVGINLPLAKSLAALERSHPTRKANPRRWTKEEDDALRQAVENHKEKNWKAIAAQVPGRNHTQCLQRWTKVLAPGLVKGHWSPHEDELLKRLVAGGNKNWGEVAAKIPGRTSKQCRERWHNHLDPNIVRGAYTPEEDRIILEAQARLGNRWSVIAAMLPGRTEDAVKIRWKSHCRLWKARKYLRKSGSDVNASGDGSPAEQSAASVPAGAGGEDDDMDAVSEGEDENGEQQVEATVMQAAPVEYTATMADDAGENEAASKGGELKAEDAAPRDDVAVTLMGNVLEKLRILNYEREMGKKKSFTPYVETQFAVLSGNASTQFKGFLELVVFLMKQCNQEFVVDKYDDPNTSVNKLILALKVMGFPLDFPASKLKLGYGEAVCAALEFICDKALAARNFGWPRPCYPKEDFADEAEVDEDAEVDAAADDVPVEAEEEEELYSDMVRAKVEDNALEESYQQMIVSEVDPLLWKTELERVGPRLKVHAKDDDGKEWHAHIERTRKHETMIKELLPRSNTQLKLLGTQLSETIERMGAKEKQINNQYEQQRQEFHQIKDRLQAITERCKEESDKVNAMTNEHASITEQLREIKTVMDERGSKMTDTSPLVAIKDALKALNAEIKNFELRIGVVGHTLLQAKARQASSGLRRKPGESGSYYQDPEYDQSDDDSS